MKKFRLNFINSFSIITVIIIFSCSNSSKQADPEFTIRTINVGKGPGSIESGDFNKDGFADIAVANSSDSSVTILLGDGKGNFTTADGSPFFANRFPNDIAIADINKDGNLDIGIANTDVSFLTILSGNGKGQFQQPARSPFIVHSKPHTHGIAIGDFNGDGNLDLATDSWGENRVVIIFSDGKMNFGNETFYKVGNRPYQRLRAADINKDG
ncbi:MAG TPA: VCBS repeat-containing protein, partial [Chitinophagaceae bacterium]|nr:VCBS repeat-containing protein [Chitinophagaceae bacterium]